MDIKKLQKNIKTLINLEETSDPVISCYINLEKGVSGYRNALNERLVFFRKNLSGKSLISFEAAITRIEAYLRNEIIPAARGAVLFSRVGGEAFFLPMQFRAPLPNWFSVDSTPNIYHLVELKDNYSRFIIMISTTESARILEVNLGAITAELWKERPELRQRVGREWTKHHYQSHRRERTERFIKEKIGIVDKLMSAGGHKYLILAGNPVTTARIRKQLPKQLEEKLVDTLVASGKDQISDVVDSALSAFIEWEEKESQAMVDILQSEMFTHGLSVVGTKNSYNALVKVQADTLVVAKDYEPETAWKCSQCKEVHIQSAKLLLCPECGNSKLNETDMREEMAKLAEKTSCLVEVVNYSDFLMAHGGVGCLLRYRTEN